MFAIFLVLVNISTIVFGIYQFDYIVDNSVNNILVIFLSIIAGSIVMFIVFLLYVDIFYITVAKTLPKTSKLKHYIAKRIMTIPLVATNTKIKVEGYENLPIDPGFSIYANHTSMMDIPVLMFKLKKYPVAFLQKEAVRKFPMVGKWTPPLGCVSVDRSNDRKAAESIIQVIKNVKSGSTMVVFPEGTRSDKLGETIEFKAGSFKVALKSKAPLVPISIVKPKDFLQKKWPRRKHITLHIHKPLEFNEFRKMSSQELCDKVKTIIEEPLQKNW